MSLSRRRQRALDGIERDLVASDPGLGEFYRSFALRAAEREMPRAERVASWPYRMLARLWRGKSITERVRDWCAENWTDP